MGTPRRRAVVNAFANWPIFTTFQRARLLRYAGVHCGPDVQIEGGFRIAGDADLWLGRGCFLNHDVYIDCVAAVRFGEYTAVAHGAHVITSHHEINPDGAEQIVATTEPRAITIGSRVWVGASSVILPGVTIADRTVIGANSVVTRDTEPNGVYVGAPARRIRDI